MLPVRRLANRGTSGEATPMAHKLRREEVIDTLIVRVLDMSEGSVGTLPCVLCVIRRDTLPVVVQ